MTRRSPLPLLLLALALGCGPAAGGRFGSWTPTVRATPEIAALERQMFERLNRDRGAQGLPPLIYAEDLADVARGHSLDMVQHRFFAHESPATGTLEDRMDVAGITALEMRENLAQAPNVERAEDNLLASPGHRANILAASVTHIGIGIVHGGNDDPRLLTITQVFTRPARVATPAEAADEVTARLNQARQKAGLPPLTPSEMLQDLAATQIESLPDDVAAAAVDRAGDEVRHALEREGGHGLVAVQVVAQTFFTPEQLDLPTAAVDPRPTAFGIATATATDRRGRPQVKLLLLLGRSR